MYIGKHQSSKFDPRYMGSGILIARAIRKHGKINFKTTVIALADSKCELARLEIKLISEYRKKFGAGRLYNITAGGDGGNGGVPHTMETKRKIALAREGTKMSKEARIKMSNSHKPSPKAKAHRARLHKLPKTPEWRFNIAQAQRESSGAKAHLIELHKSIIGNTWNIGRRLGKETRKRMSDSHTHKWAKIKALRRSFKQCSPNDDISRANLFALLRTIESQDAAKETSNAKPIPAAT